MRAAERSIRLFLVIAISLIVSGCADTEAPGDAQNPAFGVPVVPGIRVTKFSPEPLGHWGDPHEGEMVAFPNPFPISVTVRFILETRTEVLIWIVRGIGPGEQPADEKWATTGGAVIVCPQIPVNVRTLMAGEKYAGAYELTWDGRDSNGSRAPVGFYRIYMRTGTLDWVDVLLVNSREDLPPGLEWIDWID